MSSLREIMQSSSTIATGSIVSHGRRQYTEPVYYPSGRNNPYKPGDCKVSHKTPEEIEAMLQEQHGAKLQEKRDRKEFKPPSTMIDLSDMNRSPESIAKRAERKTAARQVLEPAKLQPKHLSADRLHELVAQGKSRQDIMRMYGFSSENYFRDKVNYLGCSDLFKKGKAVG